MTCSGTPGCECAPSSGTSFGTISDGPSNYLDNANCTWLIASAAEITLSFTSFETEGGYDFVIINRCSTSSCTAPVMLAELDGSSVSADTTYTSSTGYLQVVFTSDRSVTRAGFVATWRTTPVSQQTPTPPLPVPVTTPTPSRGVDLTSTPVTTPTQTSDGSSIPGCSVTSSAACARFFALVLARPSFSSVSTRASDPVGSAILPVYNALGGPQGKGHVTFDRTQSQYLDAGPRTLNIATNGGLTIVAVVRFTGTVAYAEYGERIIDLGSGSTVYVNNLVMFRPGTASHLKIELWNGGSAIISSTLSGVIVQNSWLTAVVRYRASTGEWWFTVNGVAASAETASASLVDRTVSLTYMGRSQWWDDAYFNGDIAGVFVVDEYLSTDATSALADAMVRGVDLTSTPVTTPTQTSDGSSIPGCSVTSSAACARFFALVLARPSFSSVSTRASAPVGSAILPVYNALGGPQGKGHVTFDRTKSQYLDAGPRTLNIATNGGLTIVVVARFTGTPAYWERIIELASGPNDHMVVGRWETSTNLNFEVYDGSTLAVLASSTGVIVQNSWLTAVVRYRASTREWWFTVNGVAASVGTASASLADKTLSLTYMGRSQISTDAYFNGDMAGVFVVDEYLSTDATSALADAMVRGVDLTSTTPTVICVCLCIYTHTHTQQQQYHDLYSSTGKL